MILSHDECQSITSQIDIPNIEEYITARIEVVLNCCNDTKYFYEIPDITNTDITDDVYLDIDNNFIINPSLFGGDIVDGVYTIEIILYQLNGSSFGDTGCIFIDCETKCKVYEFIKTLTLEEEKTEILMQHYSLTVGSNCSCDCSSLCSIYKSLVEKLGDIDYDCGCL